MHRQILYFSVWSKHRKEFKKKGQRFENKYDFKIVDEGHFNHAQDLLLFLEEEKKHNILRKLYVVIDYLPFFSKKYNYEKESDIIRRIILGFPEIYFLFDETHVSTQTNADFTTFLFKKDQFEKLSKEYHYLNMNNLKKNLHAIANMYTNLFDGTNLRYCLKKALYDGLDAHHNFIRIQTSRCENLAICVEEERTQSQFNSFALYANGFRVWPIMSAMELKDFNEKYQEKSSDLRIIIRDYDLQFPDANTDEHSELGIKDMEPDENLVDYIRGAKYIDIDHKWRALDDDKKNHFWYKLRKIPKIFISKGVDHIKIITTEERHRQERICCPNTFQHNESEQIIRGMHKPVTGIYSSFRNFEDIRTRYDEDIQWNWDKITDKDKEDYYIQTSRKEHHHGVPLDIYDLTKGMIDRARKYRKNGLFVVSAMVAQEAIEILNGFHESLMLKAYYIYAVSENGICMNLLGGNEHWLEKDAIFRVNKIRYDLNRMLARRNENLDRKNLLTNILNQIYSDCRLFCKEKEHFKAEEAFISAMAHLNDGVPSKNPWLYMKSFILNANESCARCWSNIRMNIRKLRDNTKKELICAIMPLLYDNYNKNQNYKELKDDCWRLTGIKLITISTDCYIGIREQGKIWKSFDDTILSVNENGFVIAHKNGLVLVSCATNSGTKYHLILVKKDCNEI